MTTVGVPLKHGNKDVAWDVEYFKQGREVVNARLWDQLTVHL